MNFNNNETFDYREDDINKNMEDLNREIEKDLLNNLENKNQEKKKEPKKFLTNPRSIVLVIVLIMFIIKIITFFTN